MNTEHDKFKRAVRELRATCDLLGEGLSMPCSYCGHKYNVVSVRAFEEHVLVCPDHPFAVANKAVEVTRGQLDSKNSLKGRGGWSI